MDLLRKSQLKSEFNVVNAHDEVEAEAEAFAAVVVTPCEDTKDFKLADDVLNVETQAGKGAVGLFFPIGQRMMLGRFGG